MFFLFLIYIHSKFCISQILFTIQFINSLFMYTSKVEKLKFKKKKKLKNLKNFKNFINKKVIAL